MADKLVPLTQGKSAIVDPEDFDWLDHWRWHVDRGYAVRRSWRDEDNRRRVQMHQAIFEHYGVTITAHVDHINGDPLDNRKSNLRLATCSQNLANSKLRKDNKSGFKGVSFNQAQKKWFATINVGKKDIFLGRYGIKEEAALAYNKATAKYFGEFANFNNVILRSSLWIQ